MKGIFFTGALISLVFIANVLAASLSDKKKPKNKISEEQDVISAKEEILGNETLTTTLPVIEAFGNEEQECRSFSYCNGERFPSRLDIGKTKETERRILCDQVPQPKDKCCLPQTKHLVCYNVMVDGKYVNFDRTNPMRTTDFTALCAEMIKVTNSSFNLGRYTSANPSPGGGGVIYLYDHWIDESREDPFKSGFHIQDIACGLDN